MGLSKFKPTYWDPRRYIAERAMRRPGVLSAVQFIDRGNALAAYGDEPLAADGIYYRDSKGPFVIAAQSSVSLATTDKMIFPSSYTSLPANYFTPGKKLKITAYGTMTTSTTPGNLGVELYYGTTDAGGTVLATSAAYALTASRTSMPWLVEAWLHCRSVGSAGVVFAYARAHFGGASTNDLIASPFYFLVPASAPTQTTIDTTAASAFNVQFKRSGSTGESITTHDLIFEALN